VGSMPSQLTATYWRRLNTGMRTLGSASTASQQGLSPTTPLLTLRKDSELRSSLAEDTCHGDIFTSSIKAKNWLASSRRAATANSRRQKLEQEMHKAGRGHTSQPKWSWLVERNQAVQLATDVKSLIQWLNHDILALAGPPWAERQNSLISSSKS